MRILLRRGLGSAFCAALILGAAGAGPALAHHSFSMFDSEGKLAFDFTEATPQSAPKPEIDGDEGGTEREPESVE